MSDVWECCCCGKPRRECEEFIGRMARWGIPMEELTETVVVIPLQRKGSSDEAAAGQA